jgi:hypothetical protein
MDLVLVGLFIATLLTPKKVEHMGGSPWNNRRLQLEKAIANAKAKPTFEQEYENMLRRGVNPFDKELTEDNLELEQERANAKAKVGFEQRYANMTRRV